MSLGRAVGKSSFVTRDLEAIPHLAYTPRIAALGGGTGLPAVVEGLCDRIGLWQSGSADCVTAIVTMTDDGGSSGRLRTTLGMLPPGDVRNCVLAGTKPNSPYRALLQQRFETQGALEGHAVGNLLLAMMSQMTGSFPDAIQELSRLVDSRARVLPASGDHVSLRAEFSGGVSVSGETAIVSRRQPIHRLWLDPAPRPLPDALASLLRADAIVVGPGSLYTSVLPALMVQGMAATIYGINAVRIYVANLMTQPGETDGFTLDDHLRVIREHTGYDLFDYVLINRCPIAPDLVARYEAQGAHVVAIDRPLRWSGHARLVEAEIACEAGLTSGKIRHAPGPLADAILPLVRAGRPPLARPA